MIISLRCPRHPQRKPDFQITVRRSKLLPGDSGAHYTVPPSLIRHNPNPVPVLRRRGFGVHPDPIPIDLRRAVARVHLEQLLERRTRLGPIPRRIRVQPLVVQFQHRCQLRVVFRDLIKPTQINVARFVEAGGNLPVRLEVSVSQGDQWVLRWLGLGANSYCEADTIQNLSPAEAVRRINLMMTGSKKESITTSKSAARYDLETVMNDYYWKRE